MCLIIILGWYNVHRTILSSRTPGTPQGQGSNCYEIYTVYVGTKIKRYLYVLRFRDEIFEYRTSKISLSSSSMKVTIVKRKNKFVMLRKLHKNYTDHNFRSALGTSTGRQWHIYARTNGAFALGPLETRGGTDNRQTKLVIILI